jgi:hypothetical protein
MSTAIRELLHPAYRSAHAGYLLSIARATSFRATLKYYLMRPEKKIIELEDCIVTLTVRPKKLPKAENDNLPYDFWSDELKEFLDRYDK